MTWVLLMFVVGILFIAAEVVVPGAVLGTIGVLLMVAACVFTFIRYGNAAGLLAVGVAVVTVGAALFFEFRVLPRTAIGKRAFLTREITAVSAPLGAEAGALVGKPAQAVTLLSPSGYVLVEGRRYEAFSRSGQIPAGTALEVVGADNFRLIVSINPSTSYDHA